MQRSLSSALSSRGGFAPLCELSGLAQSCSALPLCGWEVEAVGCKLAAHLGFAIALPLTRVLIAARALALVLAVCTIRRLYGAAVDCWLCARTYWPLLCSQSDQDLVKTDKSQSSNICSQCVMTAWDPYRGCTRELLDRNYVPRGGI